MWFRQLDLHPHVVQTFSINRINDNKNLFLSYEGIHTHMFQERPTTPQITSIPSSLYIKVFILTTFILINTEHSYMHYWIVSVTDIPTTLSSILT